MNQKQQFKEIVASVKKLVPVNSVFSTTVVFNSLTSEDKLNVSLEFVTDWIDYINENYDNFEDWQKAKNK